MMVLHLKYILNKYNIVAFSLILGIFLIILIINMNSISNNYSIEFMRDTYFYNVVLILKLILNILIVFIISISSTNYQESYQLFIINQRKERIKFFLTKILVLFLITCVTICLFFILFVAVGLLGSNWFIIEKRHLLYFFYLSLNSFMYGMFTYCLIKYLNSLIVVIIPCLIVVFQEAFIDSAVVRYVSYLFPIIINGIEPRLSYGIIHLIILIFCYIGIGLIKSYIMDIK